MRYLYVFAFMTLCGCSPNRDTDFYIQWARDYANSLHVKKQFDVFNFDVQYQPGWYLQAINTGRIDSIGAEFQDDLQQYILDIEVKGNNVNILNYNALSSEEVQQRQYYFSYQFEHDVVLEENGRTYPCVLYHFEGANDLASHRRFIIGFENGQTEDADLVINSALFSSLPIRIRVSKKIPHT